MGAHLSRAKQRAALSIAATKRVSLADEGSGMMSSSRARGSGGVSKTNTLKADSREMDSTRSPAGKMVDQSKASICFDILRYMVIDARLTVGPHRQPIRRADAEYSRHEHVLEGGDKEKDRVFVVVSFQLVRPSARAWRRVPGHQGDKLRPEELWSAPHIRGGSP